MERSKQKAVIFDFDYTLGDSTSGIVLSINHALEKLGYSAKDRESIRKTIGLSLKETFFALTGNHDEEEADLFSNYFKEQADLVMTDHTKLYCDAAEVLQSLKRDGCKIGIVTTKFHYRIEQILTKFGVLDLVDLIVGAEDVKIEKPDPEGLLWAIDALQLKRDDILYVGDSLVDAQTANNAQVGFAGVLTGTTAREQFQMYPHVFIGESLSDVYHFIVAREYTSKNREKVLSKSQVL